RHTRCHLRFATEPLHASAALGDAGRRSDRKARTHHPEGRAALAVRSAQRLRLSPTLPAGFRAVSARSAASAGHTDATKRLLRGSSLTAPALSLDDLRHYAVARTLFKPTTLARAIEQLAFVQADPIRAPARAQDLVLRHRVRNYHAGDLERRYARLGIEE